jgi:hypothetical protein
MKALTIWQAWASLAALGPKENETRGWATQYRGRLAIHAAARPVKPDELHLPGIIPALESVGIGQVEDLPLSAILGVVWLVDCIRTEKLMAKPKFRGSQEYLLGNYEPGRFAWKLRVLHVFDDPIPCRGAQGLWEWDEKAATT